MYSLLPLHFSGANKGGSDKHPREQQKKNTNPWAHDDPCGSQSFTLAPLGHLPFHIKMCDLVASGRGLTAKIEFFSLPK